MNGYIPKLSVTLRSRLREGGPGAIETPTVVLTEQGEHPIGMRPGPPPSRTTHAQLHHVVAPTLHGPAANGVPRLPELRIAHPLPIALKVARGLAHRGRPLLVLPPQSPYGSDHPLPLPPAQPPRILILDDPVPLP